MNCPFCLAVDFFRSLEWKALTPYKIGKLIHPQSVALRHAYLSFAIALIKYKFHKSPSVLSAAITPAATTGWWTKPWWVTASLLPVSSSYASFLFGVACFQSLMSFLEVSCIRSHSSLESWLFNAFVNKNEILKVLWYI